MQRAIAAFVVLAALAAAARGQTDCGITTTDGNLGSGWNNNIFGSSGAACTTGGSGPYTVDSCSVYTTGGGGTADVSVAIYNTGATQSDWTLICSGTAADVSATAGWKVVTMSGCSTLASSTSYRIYANTDSSGLDPGRASDGGPLTTAYSAETYGSWPANLGGETFDTFDEPLSAYCTLSTGGGPAPRRRTGVVE